MKAYKQIRADIAKLEREAEAARKAESAGVVAKIRKLAAEYGLTAADIGLGGVRQQENSGGSGSLSVKAAPKKDKVRKLSVKEKAELGRLPDKIDAAERERDELYQQLADSNFLRNGQAVARAKARLESLIVETDALTARWLELASVAE